MILPLASQCIMQKSEGNQTDSNYTSEESRCTLQFSIACLLGAGDVGTVGVEETSFNREREKEKEREGGGGEGEREREKLCIFHCLNPDLTPVLVSKTFAFSKSPLSDLGSHLFFGKPFSLEKQ